MNRAKLLRYICYRDQQSYFPYAAFATLSAARESAGTKHLIWDDVLEEWVNAA